MRQAKVFRDHPSVIRYEYKGRSARFRQVEEGIVYIAVADLTNLFMCHYINWNDLRMNCASLAKITFYKNKSVATIYAIEAYDLTALCRVGCHGTISQRNQEIIDWAKQQVKMIKNKSHNNMEENNNTNTNNDIQIFNNEEFGKIRIAGTPEQPQFCLSDVCKALNLRQNDVVRRLDKGVVSTHPLSTVGGIQQFNFVNEDGLYDVILDSRKPEAKRFRKWVTSEVLPSIRKHGAYMTADTIQKALTSPDFLIQLATQLKEEQQKRVEAEQKNVALIEDNNYKKSIIEGLTDNIPLADMRQRIAQIMRKGGVSSIREDYKLLYNEFEKKYHLNLNTRMNNVMYAGSKMDYIENELGMIRELYELTCKLFESQYNALMESWDKAVKRVTTKRN